MLTPDDLTPMKLISADSHVNEPPDCYVDRIDPKYRDIAPRLMDDPVKGAVYVVEGLAPIGAAFASSAGIPPEKLRYQGRKFSEVHKGGYEPRARIADMDRDGVAFEVLYPSIGMALYSVPDINYMRACFDAYNRWLEEFVAAAPDRLAGIGQSTAASPEVLIADMERIKAMGFKGVMMPAAPGVEDYDSPIYDPAWAAAVDLDLPLCFHLLTGASREGNSFVSGQFRGGKLNRMPALIRLNQDIIGVFIYGGVFDRHPKLRLISVEADAGWVPHYMKRMDHAYERHRFWVEGKTLSRKPSEYLFENVYLTFQDDESAYQVAHLLNPERLMWASDFPHSDSTWPKSRETIAVQAGDLDPKIVKRIVHHNAKACYRLAIN